MKTIAGPAALGLGLIVVMTGLGLWTGGLYATRYEGDMLHLVDMILRVAAGDIPHRDFMTPLGILSVWPISIFVTLGVGVGKAIMLGQGLVALVLLPLTVWVAISRFEGWLRYAFTALVCVFVLAIVHGGTDAQISLSMHYNRWAWALAFVALPVAMLPPLRDAPLWDAAAMGLPLAALVLIKLTYVIALVPAIVVLLLARRMYAQLGWGVAIGVAVLAAFTLWSGIGYWANYATDLLTTATSELRAFPGLSLSALLTGPLYLGAHLAALGAIIVLRRGGAETLGLGLLILLPGFIYITYQNFGNDAQWMVLLGLVLWQTLPRMTDAGMRQAAFAIAIALLAFGTPLALNIAISPVRHASSIKEDFALMFPSSAQHDDFLTNTFRANLLNVQIPGEERMPLFAEYEALGDREEEPGAINGEALPRCGVQLGTIAYFEGLAQDLQTAGYGDARILVADLLSALWMFGDGFPPLPGAAPWRYGGAPGLPAAEYVLVPLCAINEAARTGILTAIDEAGVSLTEVHRTNAYILLEKDA
ncbi:hypothetical protein PARPLA_01079 [Rhodobacteraceae bacterium THAF1]|uniref:hypothetical protein n=1 Tax=Palleronia sp. THAF1 TaxID=2587842 RepID=UPI000F3C02D6|nr:hypothetical protein [Palleronia sp. THAF1]QFU07398.1 hypothetical protein FIU81_01785 [Palleronia sp. THAF1]VDC20690.1 hypothetical protein PARPLA_01079 [Rhodobacteraceae bacterium THAF1]